jgi:hypothetical protein
MGRYSTVQAYADNHAGIRKVPYEQATAAPGGVGASTSDGRAFVAPEKVVNPYGSTAGAGSGEFHVYRHARNRELQRQKYMELSVREQAAEDEYQAQIRQNAIWEEERTSKRRKKRERQKNAKKRKQNLAKLGIGLENSNGGGSNPGIVAATEDDDDEDDDNDERDNEEFSYTLGQAMASIEEEEPSTNNNNESSSSTKQETPKLIEPPFPNDGSFLEKMKQASWTEQNNANSPHNGDKVVNADESKKTH